MQTHQPSNFATYTDPAGNAVFDTFFVISDWGDAEQLFAFRSPDDRKLATAAFKENGYTCQEMTHQEAFLRIRDGMRAWLHNGDLPSEMVWSPIHLRFPARVA